MSEKRAGEVAIDKLIQLVKTSLTTKVDKENGKGLSTNDYTTPEKEKLASLDANAKVASVNGKTGAVSITAEDLGALTEHQDISGKANTADLGAVATSNSYNDLDNLPTLITSQDVQDAINSALTGVYTPKGSIAFASLPEAGAGNMGWVYNITDTFTTTAAFVEGAGGSYPAGSNVVCVKIGNDYKWDVLAGTIDIIEMTAADVQTLWDSV